MIKKLFWILLLIIPMQAIAADVQLSWGASTLAPDGMALKNYRILCDTAPGVADRLDPLSFLKKTVAANFLITITSFNPGTWYCVMDVIDIGGRSSGYSDELTIPIFDLADNVPGIPPNFTFTITGP